MLPTGVVSVGLLIYRTLCELMKCEYRSCARAFEVWRAGAESVRAPLGAAESSVCVRAHALACMRVWVCTEST